MLHSTIPNSVHQWISAGVFVPISGSLGIPDEGQTSARLAAFLIHFFPLKKPRK